MRRSYLVVYDYGMGGLWGLVKAGSAAEIRQMFPDLRVYSRRPRWLTNAEFEDIRDKFSFDIDSPGGWLLDHLNGER